MPLVIPKQDATQEEINTWIVETQRSYDSMEIDLQNKTNRELELLKHNNKLASMITSKKTDKDDTKEEEEIPFVIDKETYDKLNERERQELSDLLEEGDEE